MEYRRAFKQSDKADITRQNGLCLLMAAKDHLSPHEFGPVHKWLESDEGHNWMDSNFKKTKEAWVSIKTPVYDRNWIGNETISPEWYPSGVDY